MSRFVILSLLVTVLTLNAVSAQNLCTQIPDDCPASNGFDQWCFCQPTNPPTGCHCRCPSEAEPVEEVCEAKPILIGEPCRFHGSCDLIPNAACIKASPYCVCGASYYPVNDMSSCIKKPTLLNQICSDLAQCDSIPGATCIKVREHGGYDHECKCMDPLRPNFDGKSCQPAPTQLGDRCSEENPCGNIPSAVCVPELPGYQPKCVCPNEYVAAEDGVRCLPTRVGVRCPAGSTCDNVPGSTCFGPEGEEICLCMNSVAHESLTSC